MRIWVEFEPRDIWIGLFIDKLVDEYGERRQRFYVCVLPMFPIVIETRRQMYREQIK